MKQLQNKIAIVTGGSKGIGKSVSNALSNAGATVFILDIDEDNGLQTVKEITNINNKAFFYKINVAKENEWIEFIRVLKKKKTRC
jgi:NAD(P)-dependent dehydrogenase (short-subunit alcohol dehydrogenase family)